MSDTTSKLEAFVNEYRLYLHTSFHELWSKVPIEPDKLEAYSVIGGLLSRQVTLSDQMAQSPGTWNGHSAPLFLRAMTDLHIALAWIVQDLEERAKKYILHGLGETKLMIEHHKAAIENAPDGEDNWPSVELIKRATTWLNAQRREFFVEVNLGHWAQLDYRTMASESGNDSLYKFAYKPFSQAAHNMWPHVSVYNCRPCDNALHRHHLVPELLEAPHDLDFMYRSCKYVHKAYELFMDRFGIVLDAQLPLEWWSSHFAEPEATASP